MKTFEVTMATNGRTFTVREGESVLNAALRQGVMLPYSCKNGTCGSCKGMVISGEVHYPFHPPLALERADHAEGFALMCQAEPLEDLEIEVREIEAVRDIEVRSMPARVMEKNRLSREVMQVWLKLPEAQRLQFLAGQYVDVLLQGGKRRAFSIASSPSHEDAIELHIRHVAGGDFTGYVFDTLKERDIIRIEGPLGNFFVRNDQPERPLVFIGGGTGFAPLKAMIEDLVEKGDERAIHLYWGARYFAELYMNKLAEKWEREHENIRYHRALSHQDGTEFTAHFGPIHESVLRRQPDLSGHDVYIAGPPAMIDTAKPLLLETGLDPDRLFYDSFEFGVDVPVRVLARPH